MERVQEELGTIEIYENDIQMYADLYVESVEDKSMLYTPNNNLFTGMIKYIKNNIRFNKSICDSIDTLDEIWNTYTQLVYKYNQKPTIEEFSLLIGIHRDTIYSWLNGETRNDYSEKLSSSRSDTIKKWQDECRLNRYKGAASGNVGYIFLCKAVDGMVETAPAPVSVNEPTLLADKLPKLSDDLRQSDTDFNGNIANKLCEKNTQFKTQ